jgi:Emfourin
VRVSLTTRGGFAAAINAAQPPTIVDTADLTAEQANELTRLLRAAASAAPRGGAAEAARDAQSYTVVVDDDETFTIRASDASMPHEIAELIDWIRRTAG